MDNTIDTLKIKIQGKDESAESTLDKVISKLERIQSAADGSSKVSAFTKNVGSLKTKINNLKTDKFKKLSTQASQCAKKIENLTVKIREMETSFSDKPTYTMQKLIDKERELEAASGRIKNQLPSISTPPALSEKYTDQYNGIREQIEQVSEKQLELQDNGKAFLTVAQAQPEAYQKLNDQLSTEQERFADINEKIKSGSSSAKTFGSQVKSAFSTTLVGNFANKVKSVISSFGRIAIHRIMRSMIKQVTDAFSTGINNMYQYSKTFNGDFSKNMDSAASSLLTFKNSIGAVMAPIINLVVPWLDKIVDKVIEINNTIAMVIAGLTGKSTYSKAVRVTTEYAAAADQAADNTAHVTEKVEELKRSLAGLDEITIIGNNNNTSPLSSSNGGSDNINNGINYGSMFVETPVDMAKVNEIKEKFEKILEIAKWIALAIAAWKLANFIGSIAEALTGIGLLKSQLVGITMMIVGFSLEFSGGYHIGYGDADLWDYIKFALGSALGIAGSLLMFGANAVGWTVGIAAALIIGIVSISVGLNARLADVVEQAFYEAGGTITISDLADQFERLMQDIINTNQPIIDAGKTIDDTMENQVKPAIESIREIGKGIEYNAYTAEEKIPELEKQFETLKDGTKTILDEVYENIIRAISGSLSAALIDAGEDVPSIVALLAEIKGETDTTFESITKNFQDAKSAYDDGSISADDYASRILDLTEQMNNLVGATDPVKDSFAGVDDALARIDWQSKDAKDLAFSKVNDSATAATDAVNTAHDEIQENLETMRGWSDNADYQLALDKLMIANDATQKQQLETVKTYTAGFYDQIQSDMLAKMVDMTDTLAADYDNLNWFQKIFSGSKEDYIATGLGTYKSKIIDPTMDGLETLYRNLGIEGAGYASEAADSIISGLYTQMPTGNVWRESYVRSSTSTEEAVRTAYKKVGKALPDGLVEGIKSNSNKPSSEVQGLMDNLKDTVTGSKGFDIHSPSKVTEGYGKNIILGFVNGINNNQGAVMNSLDSFLSAMLTRFETFTNRWRTAINDMFDDMAYGWKNADFRSNGSYSYKYLATKSIQKFAQGGFPEDGLFYANHNELVGQFSNGRTAVANNEQIVEGIRGGVASANEEQNQLLREQNRLLRALLNKDSTIPVSTITSALNRQNRRNGKVTVPVGT